MGRNGGEVLNRLRVDAGLTVMDAARAVGVSAERLACWEASEQPRAKASHLERMCVIYGCDMNAIMGW